MENLGMNAGFWRDKRVLVTGHTGFKGAWLSLWLAEMGADVMGFAQPPLSHPNLFDLAGVAGVIKSRIADINNREALDSALAAHRPEFIFHLAAQALVRASYADPVSTFTVNVGGVVSLLDAIRRTPSVRAVVIVTSDKCYDNKEWVWGYRENDALGGRDPYSASKGCAEIAARSMQMSFFKPYAAQGHDARIATVRAGNVIGGGDWSQDRLVPDIVRGCLGESGLVHLRNPGAVRPWQHVLEPLAAYLALAELLATGVDGIDESWNIGPDPSDNRAVLDVARAIQAGLGVGEVVVQPQPSGPHEANLLTLDCTKAKARLGWKPRLAFNDCIGLTASWYSAWHQGADMAKLTREQIAVFQARACTSPEAEPMFQRSA